MLTAERSIVHLNVVDFAVAVERALEPRLRERPVIVAPEGTARACVFDMSDEAYRAGVRKGMPLDRAHRIIRDAAVLPPHLDRYERATAALFNEAKPYSPLVERADENGHLFLDVTGTGRLWGPPPDVAWRIRKTARDSLGFDPVWTVAPNKLLAKVASRLGRPNETCIVEDGEEAGLLAPVPMDLLPGVEREDLERLRTLRLRKAGDVAALSLGQLEVALGLPSRARKLHELVRGIDRSEVLPATARRPVVRVEHTFAADTNSAPLVTGALYGLVEAAGAELRERQLAARRIGVVLDYSDGVRVIRSATPAEATASDRALYGHASEALRRAWVRRVRVRHLRLVCDRLIFPPAQLNLFEEEAHDVRKGKGLDRALDKIRKKYGLEAVRVGRTLPVQQRP
ncbi:MAG: hypothetical protein KIS92_06350 [Planctomycetota bacterium]|nr:hypothetical protein [Planctomycetota bacterium]